jgi:hypothetical protein
MKCWDLVAGRPDVMLVEIQAFRRTGLTTQVTHLCAASA